MVVFNNLLECATTSLYFEVPFLTPQKAIIAFRTKDQVEEYEFDTFSRSDTLYVRTLGEGQEEVPPQQPTT